jgi:tight adherence protein C
VLSGFVGLGAGLAMMAAVPALGAASLVAGASLGAVVPAFLVEATMKTRQLNIRRGLPYVLDVLCLALGAGADFTGAVSEVVDKARSNEDLREEFAYFLQQLQVGQSRLAALRELAERVPIAPIRELALAMQQAEERGNSVVATLEIQATASRLARTNEAEKAADVAKTKIVVPTFGFSAIGLYFIFTAMNWFELHIMSSITSGGGM